MILGPGSRLAALSGVTELGQQKSLLCQKGARLIRHLSQSNCVCLFESCQLPQFRTACWLLVKTRSLAALRSLLGCAPVPSKDGKPYDRLHLAQDKKKPALPERHSPYPASGTME